ncbi:MAG: SLC13 family permease [Chthonomonadales bacterium]
MTNLPLLIITAMIVCLLIAPSEMLLITAVAALITLVVSGDPTQLIQHVGPNAVNVLATMTATQVCIHKMMEGGLGERLAFWIANITAQPIFKNVPIGILIPATFVPVTMVTAAMFHNLTAILVLAPIAIYLCKRFEIENQVPLLSAMLIASNLGGASSAFGDTPAILQRQIWNFSPATFAASMVPRNFVILIVLTSLTCWLTARGFRSRLTGAQENLIRSRIRNEFRDKHTYAVFDRRQSAIGTVGLITFIASQFSPFGGMQIASAILLPLLIMTPSEKRAKTLLALGLEPTLVILSIFIVAGNAEQSNFIKHIVDLVHSHSGVGHVEALAYFLTAGISADGAAMTLAAAIHSATAGNLLSAWQLAGGICAGSSMLASSASAGPVLCLIARENGSSKFSFRSYAKFGVPFSVLMLVIYIGMNAIEAHQGSNGLQTNARRIFK